MSECMTFPDTVEEFMDSYKIVDTEQVYTNGTEMVPIYRMRQWFQHEPEIVRCKDCKHIIDHHYEDEGEPPYIKYTCGNKAGLEKGYQVHEWEYCSRAERRTDD